MKYVFHPAALTEYGEAVKFYAERRVELAQAFINAVEDAIFRIIQSPTRWAVVDECPLDYLLKPKNPTPPKLRFVSPPRKRGGAGGGVQ